MKRRAPSIRASFIVVPVVAVLMLLSTAAYFLGVTVSAQATPNIVAPTISGSINANSPGTEAFWNQLTPIQIPLTATNDYGGAIKSASVRMANNGTHILISASWSDPTRSQTSHNTIEEEAYPGLFYANNSYAYEDRIVFWWSLNQAPGSPPCMQKAPEGHGEGEALAGTGNLWHWKGARTDSGGASYGKLKYGSGPNKGQPLIPLHSYADNEFINSTGHYQLGWDQYPTAASPGNFTIGNGENGIPYNTFLIYAHGAYNSSTRTWNWVGARSLTTTPTLHTVQFAQGTTYYFAMAVFDGGPLPLPTSVPHPSGWTQYGENEETKSISTWFTMALSPSGQTATTSQTQSTVTVIASGSQGVSAETALIVSAATLIAGLVVGALVVSRYPAKA